MQYQRAAVVLVVISTYFVAQSRVIQRRSVSEDDLNEDFHSSIDHQDQHLPSEKIGDPTTTTGTLPPNNRPVGVPTTLSPPLVAFSDICQKTLALVNMGIQLDTGLQKALGLLNCQTGNNEGLQVGVSQNSNLNDRPNSNTFVGGIPQSNVMPANSFNQNTQTTTRQPRLQTPLPVHNVEEESLK